MYLFVLDNFIFVVSRLMIVCGALMHVCESGHYADLCHRIRSFNCVISASFTPDLTNGTAVLWSVR